MKTKTKALLLALCAVLLVVTTVFVTMAYLTSTTGTVKNTFTVGNVGFDDKDDDDQNIAGGLDEAKVNEYGEVDTTATQRVTENTYKLIPGKTYTKDPTVHMADDSEAAWLFVKVENGISAIEATGKTSIHEQMVANGWTLVEGQTNIYSYEYEVTANQDIPVFGTFTLADDAVVSNYATANNAGSMITIQALAIQADGFNTAADAWKGNGSAWPQVASATGLN